MMNVGIAGFAIANVIIMLAFYLFIIYVLVRLVQFMNTKNRHDAERNDQLERLIHVLENQQRDSKIERATNPIEKQSDNW